MRRSSLGRFKFPKNAGVAPRYDIWHKKYEPWQHLRRMAKLVGTGFYVPPEWYQHMRMFPPVGQDYPEEETLNPFNADQPTQTHTRLQQEREAVRLELAHRSRSLASEGARYYSIFWVRRPLDEMEQTYYSLRAEGYSHAKAIDTCIARYHATLTTKKRVAAIQAEEARLSGRFVTMREATSVLQALAHLHRARLSPHRVAALASARRKASEDDPLFEGTVGPAKPAASTTASALSPDSVTPTAVGTAGSADDKPTATPEAAQVDGAVTTPTASPSASADSNASVDALSTLLESDASLSVTVTATTNDTQKKLYEAATADTGSDAWYDGDSPRYDV